MKNRLLLRSLTLVMALCIATLPALQTANAAVIPTDSAIELTERDERIERINTVLARENVQQALIDFGVDPADASARVMTLTDTELQTLEAELDELPAGGTGFLEVIGIVAVVLIVLELLNVTNFFSEF